MGMRLTSMLHPQMCVAGLPSRVDVLTEVARELLVVPLVSRTQHAVASGREGGQRGGVRLRGERG